MGAVVAAGGAATRLATGRTVSPAGTLAVLWPAGMDGRTDGRRVSAFIDTLLGSAS